MRQLDEIQADINIMDTAIQGGGDTDNVATWQAEKDKFVKEFAEAKTYWEAQGRVEDAKTVAVTSASLIGIDPDVAELIGIYVSDAVQKEQNKNEEIIQQLTEANKGKLDNLTAQAVETENQLTAERTLTAQLQEQTNALQASNSQLAIEKQDAEQKRDAAIREKEAETSRVNHLSNLVDDANTEIKRLNDHVDDLRVKLANAPAPKAAIDVTPNERAQELIAKIQLKNVQYADFKRSTLQGEDKDGNIVQVNYLDANKIEHVTEFPSLPPLEVPNEQVATFPDQVQASDSTTIEGSTGNTTVHEGVEQKAAEETTVTYVTKDDHDALAARVAALESGSGQVAA